MPSDYDVVVIGSGAGGLGAALSLARAGQRVLVVEQHDRAGGWLHSFTIAGHRFDTGVHYLGELGPGGFSRSVFEGLGVGDRLTFAELNADGYDRVTVGNRSVRFPKGFDALKDRLCDTFPHDASGIARVLDRTAAVRRTAGEFRHAANRTELWRRLGRSPHRAVQAVVPLEAHFRGEIDDPEGRAVLASQHAYYALPPKRVPLVVHAAVTGHYYDGGWYPIGGGRALVVALVAALRSHGGEVAVRSRVSRILMDDSSRSPRAAGVELVDGSMILAPTIISNADPGVTFGSLVDEQHLGRRRGWATRHQQWSASCLSLFMTGDFDADEFDLDSGNVVYMSDPDVGRAYSDTVLDGPGPLPYLFLTVASLKDRTAIRDGKHTLEAFAPAPWRWFARWQGTVTERRPADYNAEKRRLTERMLSTLDLAVPGLRDRIEIAELGTPLTNQHYVAGTGGSMYGTRKSLFNVGPFSHPVKTDIAGLWMCGDSTVAHGVVGSLFSGVIAAAGVLETDWHNILTRGEPIRTVFADSTEDWPADLRARLSGQSTE